MKFILLIAWMVQPGQPEILTFEFQTIEQCRGAAQFAAQVLEKAPTKDGVKFLIQCGPGKEPPVQKEDREI